MSFLTTKSTKKCQNYKINHQIIKYFIQITLLLVVFNTLICCLTLEGFKLFQHKLSDIINENQTDIIVSKWYYFLWIIVFLWQVSHKSLYFNVEWVKSWDLIWEISIFTEFYYLFSTFFSSRFLTLIKSINSSNDIFIDGNARIWSDNDIP